MELTQENFDIIVARLEAAETRLSGGKLLIGTHGNQNFAELRTTQVITGPGNDYMFFTLFTAAVSGIKQGDKFNAFAELEVTNPYTWGAMYQCTILFATSMNPPADVEAFEASVEVTEGNGTNFIGIEEHHHNPKKFGTWTAPQDYTGTRYFNLVAWSSSSNANTANTNKLKVEMDYGRFWVDQFR